MISGFMTLLLFQVAGDALVFVFDMPIPGPVVGMVLLFVWLAAGKGGNHGVVEFSTRFLRHLSLLFIPAAVGIMLHVERLAEEWLAILVAVLGSLVISIVVTAYLMLWAEKDG